MHAAGGGRIELHQAMYEALNNRLQGAVTLGFGVADEAQGDFLRNNVQLFAGAKTAHQTKAMTKLLLDESGAIKPWSTFKLDTLAIHEQYNERWLQAEYEHAVASAQMAARWQEFGPNDMLSYQTAGDSRVREEHRAWDNITRPADDEWWNTHYPPNGWLCRCLALVTDVGGKPTPRSVLPALPDPDPLFSNNVGKTGIIFPEEHPYFSELSEDSRKALQRAEPGGVYKVVKYSKSGPAYRQMGVRTALNSIDRVHLLPEVAAGEAPLPIKFAKMKGYENGEFSFPIGGTPSINLSNALASREQVAFTALHELGHYLDYQHLAPTGGLTRFADGSDLVLVLKAARESQLYGSYQRIVNDFSLPIEASSYAEYLSRPEELWARAYSQYIAEKSTDEGLLGLLEKLQRDDVPTQWTTQDFAPIREAIHSLFVHKKWITPSE
ncbi:hypothetical protein GCM10023185_06980 [Hymenobacter saemangeumensis]|uniref:Phage head morphogenesis domain-containing protein n=1 Tax=Hymenobacter saemangeumensis TaxID=1084522 RepID=A0ABP8I2H4_9BACT